MATIKTKCKDPPACEGAPRWQRQQRRWNPAAAKPFQLLWRVVGVEEAEIKASVVTLMLPQMERRSTHLQQPGKALCLPRSSGGDGCHRLQRQIQKTKFSVSKPCEGMLPNFQGLPVRAHIFFSFRCVLKKKKTVHAFGSYQVKSQTVSTTPNQTKALRFWACLLRISIIANLAARVGILS